MKPLRILILSVPILVILTGCSGSGGSAKDDEPSQVILNQQEADVGALPSGQNEWKQSDSSVQQKFEEPFDADGDGIPDYVDVDAGGDGFISGPPSGEMHPPFDADGDGIPNSADWDKDGDGIAD
jgi:hypothetical protein